MFDKEKFYKNVSYMAKQRNIAMGEIEDKLEISHGYIAKLGRPNSPLPSIDYITKIADLLDISIDLLVDGDLGNLSTQEQFINQNSKKVINDKINVTFENNNIENFANKINEKLVKEKIENEILSFQKIIFRIYKNLNCSLKLNL